MTANFWWIAFLQETVALYARRRCIARKASVDDFPWKASDGLVTTDTWIGWGFSLIARNNQSTRPSFTNGLTMKTLFLALRIS